MSIEIMPTQNVNGTWNMNDMAVYAEMMVMGYDEQTARDHLARKAAWKAEQTAKINEMETVK